MHHICCQDVRVGHIKVQDLIVSHNGLVFSAEGVNIDWFKHILLYQYTKGLGMATLRHKPSPFLNLIYRHSNYYSGNRPAKYTSNCLTTASHVL